jgi:glycosyltransferase involved in cell wall biosynthesis
MLGPHPPTLSAILITKNEAADLHECLESVAFCNEIIVVDQESSDQTIEIALDHNAKVIATRDWPGFGRQKQRALEAATSEWVLSIDADERVPALLRNEIITNLTHFAGDSINGFYINRQNYFLGRHLKHGGWSPDYVLRLARRRRCRFDLAPIHERLLVEGSSERLKNPIIHLSYQSRGEILEKRYRYATDGAQKLGQLGRKCSGGLESTLRAVWTFIRHYLLQLGILDGPLGLYAAYCKAAENYFKYRNLHRLTKTRKPLS